MPHTSVSGPPRARRIDHIPVDERPHDLHSTGELFQNGQRRLLIWENSQDMPCVNNAARPRESNATDAPVGHGEWTTLEQVNVLSRPLGVSTVVADHLCVFSAP